MVIYVKTLGYIDIIDRPDAVLALQKAIDVFDDSMFIKNVSMDRQTYVLNLRDGSGHYILIYDRDDKNKNESVGIINSGSETTIPIFTWKSSEESFENFTNRKDNQIKMSYKILNEFYNQKEREAMADEEV